MTDSMTSVVQSNVNIFAIIGVSIVMPLILSAILIITATVMVLIWSYKRRSSEQVNNCSPYSTLSRRAGQLQPLQQDSAQLYDQIHLGPSTGQAEYIPKSETAYINNPSQTPQNSYPTHSTASGEEAGAPQIPPYTIIEDLYTEVMKNPYDNPVTLDGAEAPPSIPPHIVEELYTADSVWKCNVTMDEEEPPPIPPHSVEDCY